MREDRVDAWPVDDDESGEVEQSAVEAASSADAGVAAVPDLMWRDVGLVRERAGLIRARAILDPAWRALDARIAAGEPLTPAEWRDASIVTVGRLIARAALRREESRGGHYRSDHPQRNDTHWKRRASETRDGKWRLNGGQGR